MTHLSMDALVSLRELGQEPGDAAAREHLEGCEHCGAETILTQLGLLKPWQEVMIPKKEVATSRIPDPMEENDGKPIEISKDEMPF